MSSLLRDARQFWYNNDIELVVRGQLISRAGMHLYGGPDPAFNKCPICQQSEWLSRLMQTNKFKSHSCKTAGDCQLLCSVQGNKKWRNVHQNFHFAVGIDPNLAAPRALCVFSKGRPRMWQRYWGAYCDYWAAVLKRQLAYACQIDVVKNVDGVDWHKYDLMFYQNSEGLPQFSKPPIPQIMYGHDMWRGPLQANLDRLQPDILLTPYPTAWQRNFTIPAETRIEFYFMSPSTFFASPRLKERKKKWDLLVIGAIDSPIYGLRRKLVKQLKGLSGFNVKFNHYKGSYRNREPGLGPTKFKNEDGETVRFLNAYSGFIGKAKFVIFGPCDSPADNMVLMKFYECLGSGAIPILPDEPDLKYLGVLPMQHYIPLSKVWKNNKKLGQILNHYSKYKYIAENTVQWYRRTEGRLFAPFEEVVRKVTNYQYPKRVV